MESERFITALEAWGQPEIADEHAASQELIAAAKELLATIPGVTGVYHVSSSMGSIYLDVCHEVEGEEESFTVRLSNHARKPNGHIAPVWSFEPADDVASIQRGLLAIEAAAN